MGDLDPIYHHLLKQITEAGGVPVQLDSEASLASRFRVSRWAARSVLQQLVVEGLASVEHGRGYYVRPSAEHAREDRATVGVVYGRGRPDEIVELQTQQHILALLIGRIRALGMDVLLLPVQEQQGEALVEKMVDQHPADACLLCSLPPAFQGIFAHRGKTALVYGSTHGHFGYPCIELNLLEVTRELTEGLFASGHRRICLVQELNSNIGLERSRVGFEYAHNARRVQFIPERIIRIDRRQRGWRPAMATLSAWAPSGMLIQSVGLLEQLWDRADKSFRKKLARIETIVLNPDWGGTLKHPAKLVDVDDKEIARIALEMVVDVLHNSPADKRYQEMPWKLISKTGVAKSSVADVSYDGNAAAPD